MTTPTIKLKYLARRFSGLFTRRRCRCFLMYCYPERPPATLDLNTAICASEDTLETIEILRVCDASRCDKHDGCPWFKAEREFGPEGVRSYLRAFVRAGMKVPQSADGDREEAHVHHLYAKTITTPLDDNIRALTINTVLGDIYPDPVPAPISPGVEDTKRRAQQSDTQGHGLNPNVFHDATSRSPKGKS